MSYNQIILMGNAGGDPESRETGGGSEVSFSMAVNYRRKNQEQDEVQWFRVITYQRLAEIALQYVVRGQKVLVEGRFRGREYTTKEGEHRRVNEVLASKLVFVSSKGEQTEVPV